MIDHNETGIIRQLGQARRFKPGCTLRPIFAHDDTLEEEYAGTLRIVDIEVEGCTYGIKDYQVAATKRAVLAKFLGQPSWTWKLWHMHPSDYYKKGWDDPVDIPNYPDELLGDVVETVLKVLFIHQAVIGLARWFGFSCGCDARKQWLNELHRKVIRRRHAKTLTTKGQRIKSNV